MMEMMGMMEMKNLSNNKESLRGFKKKREIKIKRRSSYSLQSSLIPPSYTYNKNSNAYHHSTHNKNIVR